jgi:hypothetical protein
MARKEFIISITLVLTRSSCCPRTGVVRSLTLFNVALGLLDQAIYDLIPNKEG